MISLLTKRLYEKKWEIHFFDTIKPLRNGVDRALRHSAKVEIRGNVNKTYPLKSPLFIHLQHLIHKINIYVTTQTYKPFYFHGSTIAWSWILRDKCRIIERWVIEFWALWIMFSVPRDNLQHLIKIRDAVVIVLFGNLQHFIRQHTIGQWRTFLIKPSMPSTSAMLFV